MVSELVRLPHFCVIILSPIIPILKVKILFFFIKSAITLGAEISSV